MSKCRPARLLISLALAALFSLAAIGGLALADGPLVGEIKIYAGSTLPNGWLWADGRELTRTSYPALFDVLSTTYGSATTETFTLPDLKYKFPLGNSTEITTGVYGGYLTHSLSINELPRHDHFVLYQLDGESGIYTTTAFVGQTSNNQSRMHGKTSNDRGPSGYFLATPFSIMPKYVVVNYIIYTGVETGTYNYMLNSGTVFEVTPTMDFGQAMLIGLLLVWFMCKIYSFVFRLVYRR